MIDVYAFTTPNSVKGPIAHDEIGLDYTLHSIDIRSGGKKDPAAFLALNPNGKVPVLIGHDADAGPLLLSESAAIQVKLAEKTGKLLLASSTPRIWMFEQLFIRGTAMGPAFSSSDARPAFRTATAKTNALPAG